MDPSTTPALSPAPAPWTLWGQAWAGVSSSGVVILARYHASPVGPYDELMWLTFKFTRRGLRPSIERIVVSTEASAQAGRANWAIPKTLACFEWNTADPDSGRGAVRVSGAAGRLCHLTWALGRPSLPLGTGWLPPGLRTLWQPAHPGLLETTVGGSGVCRPAQLVVLDGPFMPTATLLGVAARRVRLYFPEARRVS